LLKRYKSNIIPIDKTIKEFIIILISPIKGKEKSKLKILLIAIKAEFKS